MVNPSLSLFIIKPHHASTRINYVTYDLSSSSTNAPLMVSSNIRLDIIGIGGFSHDFGCLSGNTSPVAAAFESFGSIKPSFSTMLTFVVGTILPGLSARIPNEYMQTMRSIARGIREIASELLDKATHEKTEVEKSTIGALGA